MTTIFLAAYNALLTVLLIPSAIILLLFSGKYRKEVFYKIPERFSKWNYTPKHQSKKTVWIHCSSLGEVRAVEPVLERLKEEYNTVLTTITKTGRQYVEKINKSDFTALLPVDLYPFMLRAFNIIKPDMLVLVETELWASMLYVAGKKKVDIITVNGRMSAKSFKVYKALKFFWKHFISFINVVLAISSDDAARFAALAGKRTIVEVSGNIKYDRDFNVSVSRDAFGLSAEDKVFSAGSIREGEAGVIADAYIKIRQERRDVVFFAAPRHLSRMPKIIKILNDKKIEHSLFSETAAKQKIVSRFILVDVFGMLQGIYCISDVCFVGGSIVNKGGQNPIEPAACAKPVLFGKNMDNFKTEAETLLKYGGAEIVSDAGELASKTKRLFEDAALLSKTGGNALKAVNSQKGAIGITVNIIKERLK